MNVNWQITPDNKSKALKIDRDCLIHFSVNDR